MPQEVTPSPQMVHYLIAAAAPDQHRVFQILHKLAVDQHIDQLNNLLLCGVQLIDFVAGPHPDIFAGAFGADALHQL